MLGRMIPMPGRKTRLWQDTLLGLYVLNVSISEKEEKWGRSVKKAAKLLAKNGICEVLAPPGFTHWDLLKKRGLSKVDIIYFLQNNAQLLVLAALEKDGIAPGDASVVLQANRVSRTFSLAARELCPFVRTLVIRAPVGGNQLARLLHREYGLAVVEDCEKPHVTVCFSPPDGTVSGAQLVLCDPSPVLYGMTIEPKNITLPDRCDSLPLLAALWRAGMLGGGCLKAVKKEST
ncbi:hypothetical protein SDC9_56486 [bioreactor metagenome]|uniref:Uncharacterized protein n=1 Tax=bioreactor metagenome TaxID=1076179 RepID=A0A644X2Q3_9ZZZZ